MWKDCDQVIAFLKKNLGKKIPKDKSRALRKHLKNCSSCQKIYRELYNKYLKQQKQQKKNPPEGSTYKPSEASQFLPITFPGYKIIRKIGHGAMGKVYQAYQISLKRHVAIKVLAEQLSNDSKFVKRFLREARALAEIHHPNVVSIHDMGVSQGVFYYIMEYVEGESLKEYLKSKGKLPPKEACEIVLKVAKALEVAHEHNIIHRDIKPGNILLGKNGVVKLVDLGLAKTYYTSESVSDETATGTLIGTPHYMAPEQIRSSKDVTIQADIYSLGVTFFQMLTGRLPHTGKTNFEVLSAILHNEVEFLKVEEEEIPKVYRRIVLKMMAKKLEDRYQNPTELIADLKMAMSLEESPSEETFLGSAFITSKQSYWLILLSSLAGILLTLFIGLLVYSFSKSSPRPTHQSSQGETAPSSEGTHPSSQPSPKPPQESLETKTFATTDDFYVWLSSQRRTKNVVIQFTNPALVVKKELFQSKGKWRTRLYINHTTGEEAPRVDLRIYFPFLLSDREIQCGDGLLLHKGWLHYYKKAFLHPEYWEIPQKNLRDLHRFEISYKGKARQRVWKKLVQPLAAREMTERAIQFLSLEQIPDLRERVQLFSSSFQNQLIHIPGRVTKFQTWKDKKGRSFATGEILKERGKIQGRFRFLIETFLWKTFSKENKLALLQRSKKSGEQVALLGIWRKLERVYRNYWSHPELKSWKHKYILLLRAVRQPGWER